MLNISDKKHTLISCILFTVIFGGLLITATFTDMQVSRILTAGTLKPGNYIADGLFGVLFECIGCAPPYIVGIFSLEIVFIYTFRFMKSGKGKIITEVLLQIAIAVAYYVLALDIFDYNFRHYRLEGDKPAFIRAELIFVALLLTALTAFAVNNLSDETVKKFPRFACAVALAIIFSTLFVTFIKEPFGRVRYRAMNYAGDFSYYTRWYVLNGQPDKEWIIKTFSDSDACRSFPSGHTQSTAMIFCIVMLKELFNITSKKKTALLWIVSIVWTGCVALSRIMVGAHFFSDVLVGGTIGFLSVMGTREIFVYKGSHFKAFKN